MFLLLGKGKYIELKHIEAYKTISAELLLRLIEISFPVVLDKNKEMSHSGMADFLQLLKITS